MATTWKARASRRLLKKDEGERPLRDLLRKSVKRFTTPQAPRKWLREAAALRKEALAQVYLKDYPRAWLGKPRVEWGDVLRPHPAYRIRKLRYEVAPGFWSPALLYEPTRFRGKLPGTGKLPGVLNPNGHHVGGKAVLYKQARCINLAKRGMLALNTEFLGQGELHADHVHNDFGFLDFVGLPGVGLHYLNMRKALDVLLAHPKIDKRRVCMTGLSGGGWQTIVLSALDRRITCVVPVAGYNSFIHRVDCPRDRGDLEQSPVDLGAVADYTHLTAMLAPRPTLQILNENDSCCFKTADAKPWIYDRIRPTFRLLGAPRSLAFYSNVDPGNHNYEADNRGQLYRFLNKHFGLDTPDDDLPFEKELYTETELRVGLPEEQLTVHEMAHALARRLSRSHRAPRTKAQKKKLRAELTELLRLPTYRVTARRLNRTGLYEDYVLRVGPLPVPVTLRRSRGSERARLIVADPGRRVLANSEPPADRLIVAADLIGCGENEQNLYLQMLLNTTGRRLLGVYVGQLLAVAQWTARQAGLRRIDVEAYGRNASTAAAVAAAARPALFGDLMPHELPDTFCRFYQHALRYEHVQAALCPGLLGVADVEQILALAEGVTLRRDGWCLKPRRLG